jgi:predicted porin
MHKLKVRKPLLAAMGALVAIGAAPSAVFADNASDIQALKDQVRMMQQKIDALSQPETTGTVAAPAKGNPGTAAQDERKRKETPALTYAGVTLYGTVDIGVAYMTHGAPLSSSWGPGLPYFIQNFSNHSIVSAAPNGLSQSKVGLSGVEPLGFGDFTGVFRLETGFQPTSGRLTDGPGSLVADNGKAAAVKISAGDSSRAGQPFNGAAYAGISSKTFGTFTFGRQQTLMSEALSKYDPQLQAQAFSPISLQGTAGGFGDTQDRIFDQSAKYVLQVGPVHAAIIHQFGSDGYVPEQSNEASVGVDIAGLSADAIYGKVHGAVSAASLTAAQVATAGIPSNSLSATISDNTGYAGLVTYNLKELVPVVPIKLYAGWDRIKFNNPDHAITAGTIDIGGYDLSIVNTQAGAASTFNIQKILQIWWFGARYSPTPQFDLSAGYYQYNQKSFAKNGCTDASSSSCAGELHTGSLVADYHWTKRFDTYAGIQYSLIQNGLANGFLFTSDWTPMVGVRFNF